MLPTKKRRDERELVPRQRGGEEHLPNDSLWSLGTLEPKQENNWCDGQPHGFTSWLCMKEGCTHLQEPILLQRLDTAGHPEEAKEVRFHKDTFEVPAEVNNLVVSWTFATNENEKAHWAMERKVACASFTGPPSGKISVTTCSDSPSDAMLWIKEVEMVDSLEELKSSRSVCWKEISKI